MKLLRKLLIIKRRFQQKLLLKYFHKWYINIYAPYKKESKDIINNKTNENINTTININSNNNKYKDRISNNRKLLYNLINKNIDKKKNIENKKMINLNLSNKSIFLKKNLLLDKVNEKDINKLNKTTPNFFHNFNLSFEKQNNNTTKKISVIKNNKSKCKNNLNKSFTKEKYETEKNNILNNKIMTIRNNSNLPNNKLISSRNNSNIIKKNKSANIKKLIKKKKINDNIIKQFIENLTNNEKTREEKKKKIK